MKKCPYCAEDIQDAAIKCKHCGEFLDTPPQRQQEKSGMGTGAMIMSFLTIGPFALPMLWANPRFSREKKKVITVIVLAVTAVAAVMVAVALSGIINYYRTIASMLQLAP